MAAAWAAISAAIIWVGGRSAGRGTSCSTSSRCAAGCTTGCTASGGAAGRTAGCAASRGAAGRTAGCTAGRAAGRGATGRGAAGRAAGRAAAKYLRQTAAKQIVMNFRMICNASAGQISNCYDISLNITANGINCCIRGKYSSLEACVRRNYCTCIIKIPEY